MDQLGRPKFYCAKMRHHLSISRSNMEGSMRYFDRWNKRAAPARRALSIRPERCCITWAPHAEATRLLSNRPVVANYFDSCLSGTPRWDLREKSFLDSVACRRWTNTA